MFDHPVFVRRVALVALSILPLALAVAFLYDAVAAPRPVTAQGEGDAVQQINTELQAVRVTIENRARLDALSAWADPRQVAPDADEYDLEATADDLAWLERNSYPYVIDGKRTAALRAPRSPNSGGGGIPGYPCYRTVEETYTTATDIVASYPDLAQWIDIGDSWVKMQDPTQGYDLRVLKLTNQNIDGEKPVFFATSSINAREYAPAELLTRLAERLVEGYGNDADATWLLDHHEIHLVLQANPDGRKWAEIGMWWRKNANNNFCSNTFTRGVDLNRNFDFEWGCCGGSSADLCSLTYRGPSAASEPETQAYQSYGQSILIDQRGDPITEPAPEDATGVYVDVHSPGNLVLWPWGFVASDPPNADGLQTFGRHMAYFNEYEPKQAINRYTMDGSAMDYIYGKFGVASYHLEMGTQFFETCDNFETSMVQDNHAALLYAMKAARAPYLLSQGPDATAVALDTISVAVGEEVTLSATIDDTRFNNQNGSEPSQPIAAAAYYIDTPPWDGGTPVAMSPVDGTFDSPVEAVSATLDTGSLSDDQHLIFVRGQDAAGNWGVVSAIFLYVLDPATAGTLTGYVREAGTNAPLAATVQAGDGFVTQSDPTTGFYTLLLPPGLYDVTASAEGHVQQTVRNVVASSGQITQQNYLLEGICTLLADDVESGNIGWTAETPWDITAENSSSPTHAWTDSPGGAYASNVNVSLTSPPIDLSLANEVTVEFAQICDTEHNYDFCIVEASTDGGISWEELARYSDRGPNWEDIELDASSLVAQSDARLRFRLSSDNSVNQDGWYVDDIAVRGTGGCTVPLASRPLYFPIIVR